MAEWVKQGAARNEFKNLPAVCDVDGLTGALNFSSDTGVLIVAATGQ